MPDKNHHNDQPIAQPDEDRFGIDPFAKALASSIRKMASPEGAVIALNEPWGSGKSSAVNLVLYHLREAVEANEIAVVNFACWWFRGEEALALAFFRELYAGLGPSIGERFKKALPKLAARLLRAGSLARSAIDVTGAVGAGAVTSGAMEWISGLMHQEETVEKLHADLSKALADQNKRFLIVIDDIDRLSPDEALLIFRLVKSIGNLPNVLYLLAYDRRLAEDIIAKRFPSEGPHYLEKIVQAAFELPEPRQSDLSQQLLERISVICGSPERDDLVRFMNVFNNVVVPELKMPRDLTRLANMLSVTWPAVKNEVDLGDFIGLETFRLRRPKLYRAIRLNKAKLCGLNYRHGRPSETRVSAEYDRIFLESKERPEQEALRLALMRLFPPLESVWSNTIYGDDSAVQWSRQRRACSKAHFDTYFRFSLGDEALPKGELDELIERAADKEFIRSAFRAALKVNRSNGTTRAALLLDELNQHADRVPDDSVQPLLTTIFELGDKLNVASDEAKAFSIVDNQLRFHWLLRTLTLERWDLAKRSVVLMEASNTAALGWLTKFANSAYRDYHPTGSNQPSSESDCLVTSDDADKLLSRTLERIRAASRTSELSAQRELAYLLYRWRDLPDDAGAEVQLWTSEQLASDEMVVKFAEAFTSYMWSHSMGFAGLGDTVAERSIRANVSMLQLIMDKDRFRTRVEELAARQDLSKAHAGVISEFLAAWKRHDANPND